MTMNEESFLAKCYIQEENNEDNTCYLSRDNLYIKKRGIISHFPLDSIINITFKNKIFLIPIVFGGIIGSLSMIALFNAYYNVWVMMSLMMGGFALLYYGVEGGHALIVQTNVKEYDFFIRSASPNLKSFVTFVVNFQHRGEDALIHYFVLNKDIWDVTLVSGHLELKSSITLSAQKPTYSQDEVLLAVNISEVGANLRYIIDSKLNKLVPVIENKIPIEHIIVPD